MQSKIVLLSIMCFLWTAQICAQFIGIGVNNPSFKLDVSGSFRLQNTSNTSGLWFDGTSLPTRSFLGTFTDDLFGLYGHSGAGWHFLLNHNNNNFGIGITPNYRLDILGRVRIQKSTNYNAGIWFDGTSSSLRSFIGTQSGNNFGFWGGGGAGWGLIMDATTGNIGIGTTIPTQKLDLNGTLRIRSDFPVKGSILISQDANGNALWANPIHFRANSNLNHTNQNVPRDVWTKKIYHQAPDYNYSSGYNPNTSEFTATVDGIYEFQTSSIFINSNFISGIRLMMDRSGAISTIGEMVNNGFAAVGVSYDAKFYSTTPLSLDAQLNAGDKVWVEVFFTPDDNSTHNPIYPSNTVFFSANLVARI